MAPRDQEGVVLSDLERVPPSAAFARLDESDGEGIGNGPDTPMVELTIGTAVTSSCASTLINAQFQGSTNSTAWTTYAESGANSTASWGVGAQILPINVPRRPTGAALPLYYRVNLVVTGAVAGETISTGSIIGGIVLARADSPDTLGSYPAGFTVV